jgi:hypothetical protein
LIWVDALRTLGVYGNADFFSGTASGLESSTLQSMVGMTDRRLILRAENALLEEYERRRRTTGGWNNLAVAGGPGH